MYGNNENGEGAKIARLKVRKKSGVGLKLSSTKGHKM